MPAPQTIVIVEDDASFSRAADRMLRASGFDVRMFASAEDFLASPEPAFYGCLILDVQLPGMSGFELLSHLAASDPSQAAIFISAQDEDSVRARVAGLPGSAFLRKPFLRAVLLQAVQAQFRRHQPDS